MSNEHGERQETFQDEVVMDLRRLTMAARGRGLRHLPFLVVVLFLALVVSLAMLLAMVHLAARQSPAATSVIEKAISRL